MHFLQIILDVEYYLDMNLKPVTIFTLCLYLSFLLIYVEKYLYERSFSTQRVIHVYFEIREEMKCCMSQKIVDEILFNLLECLGP